MADSDAHKLKVFVSYSRRDASEFAEELVAGLELAGFAAFLDRHDITAGEDFETRLGRLVAEADTVVFVLSPEAARSTYCRWEVDQAAALSKRLMPVVFKPVPEAEMAAGSGVGPHLAVQFRAAGERSTQACHPRVTPARHGNRDGGRAKQMMNTPPSCEAYGAAVVHGPALECMSAFGRNARWIHGVPHTNKFLRLAVVVGSIATPHAPGSSSRPR